MIYGSMKIDVQVDQKILDGLKKFDTTSVSDAMDRLGIPCGLLGIQPIVAGTRLFGPAYTVRYVPCGLTKGSVGDFLDDIPPGYVAVLDNGGRTYCTVWGDLMTATATRMGLGGTVIDGVCRDVTGILEMKYPIFTKGKYMVTGKDRVEVDGYNIPVNVSGLQVKPGDIMIGDDTGAVVVPLERAKDVMEVAAEIAEKEDWIMAEIKKGHTLREARNRMGYHSLQTKK